MGRRGGWRNIAAVNRQGNEGAGVSPQFRGVRRCAGGHMQGTRLAIIAALPLVVAGLAVAQASPSSSDCPELFAWMPESRIPDGSGVAS